MSDTNVIVYLATPSRYSEGYRSLIADRRVAISFQVRAELGGYPETVGWGSARQEALRLLLASLVEVPHSEASSTWYARVAAKRRALGNGADDGDVWVVAQALEHGVALLCHDRQAVDLARAMGVEVLTLLED